MAASKKYAYYIEGNKIAVVESGTGIGMGVCSLSNYKNQAACENAGGTWTKSSTSGGDYGKYKSPQESVTEGLEIKYTYVPEYNINKGAAIGSSKFYINGWNVKDGNLRFISAIEAGTRDWTASANVGDMSDGTYIYIDGSSRWSGIHKIKSATANGMILTYTKVHDFHQTEFYKANSMDIAAESGGKALVNMNDDSLDFFNPNLKAGDYVYMTAWSTAKNNGLWKVDSLKDTAATESAMGVYLSDRFYCSDSHYFDAAEGRSAGQIEGEIVDSTCDTTAETDTSAIMYKSYRDPCTMTPQVTKMEDESFEIDLPRYLQNAIVYYLKAKQFEDVGDFEKMQFFMREFKRQVEKHHGGKVTTTHRIQGFWQMNRNL